MNQEKEKWLKPELMDNRNKIIGEFLDFTFDEALLQIEGRFESETNFSNRLALFAARSWLIRKKVHAVLHEPFAFSIGDLENLDISSTTADEDEDSLASSLFDDDDDDDDDQGASDTVEVVITKTTTLNGGKLLKNKVVEVGKKDAEKLYH